MEPKKVKTNRGEILETNGKPGGSTSKRGAVRGHERRERGGENGHRDLWKKGPGETKESHRYGKKKDAPCSMGGGGSPWVWEWRSSRDTQGWRRRKTNSGDTKEAGPNPTQPTTAQEPDACRLEQHEQI